MLPPIKRGCEIYKEAEIKQKNKTPRNKSHSQGRTSIYFSLSSSLHYTADSHASILSFLSLHYVPIKREYKKGVENSVGIPTP